MIWEPNTCYCIMLIERPSKDGEFIEKCKLHKNETRTTVVYTHNKANKFKQSEYVGTGKTRTRKQSGLDRIDTVKESTR